jgi:hypothetical protein
MDWSQKHQFRIFIIFGTILFLLIVYLVWPFVTKAPTCFDGKQNGDELGIDCGGACDLVCSMQADPLVVLWSNSSEIVSGRYNSVAYVKNPNQYAGIPSISYEFRLYDADNLLIAERRGTTFIDANANTAIFEGAIDTGERVPVRTTFRFLNENPEWIRIGQRDVGNISLIVTEKELVNADTNPRVDALISNRSLYDVDNFDVVVVLYDRDGNLVNTSSTYLTSLGGGEERGISYTWPKPFEKEVISIEIIPRLYLFN